jgi:hypothetical protein
MHFNSFPVETVYRRLFLFCSNYSPFLEARQVPPISFRAMYIDGDHAKCSVRLRRTPRSRTCAGRNGRPRWPRWPRCPRWRRPSPGPRRSRGRSAGARPPEWPASRSEQSRGRTHLPCLPCLPCLPHCPRTKTKPAHVAARLSRATQAEPVSQALQRLTP